MTKPVKAKTHSALGASTADRWMNCPGSVAMTRNVPRTETEYSREGTAAHALIELCLRNKQEPDEYLEQVIEGVVVSENMVEAVTVFLDQVYRTLQLDPGAVLYIEKDFKLDVLNPPAPMWGTSDVVIYFPASRELIVLDYKHGQGYAVDVKGNPQLRYYGLGALIELGPKHPVENITLVIVQPRAQHPDGKIRAETLSYLELFDFTEDLLEAARRALAPDAPLKAGRWCQFCPAKAVCPAQLDHAKSVALTEFDAEPVQALPAPSTLPMDVLLRVMQHGDAIESWLKSVRTYLQQMAERGETVPGYKLVRGNTHRKWRDEKKLLGDWASVAGVDPAQLLSEPKVKSPAQVEKLCKKLKVEFPALLTVKPEGALSLAPEYDDRPAVQVDPAGSEFEALPPVSDDTYGSGEE